MLFFLSLAILLRGFGTNIGGVTAFASDFKWIPSNETDLFTNEITCKNAKNLCKNGSTDLSNC